MNNRAQHCSVFAFQTATGSDKVARSALPGQVRDLLSGALQGDQPLRGRGPPRKGPCPIPAEQPEGGGRVGFGARSLKQPCFFLLFVLLLIFSSFIIIIILLFIVCLSYDFSLSL